MISTRGRLLVALLASAAIVVPLGWASYSSVMPGTYSVMDMGYLDYGGGPGADPGATTHAGHDGPDTTSVADLVTDPERSADVRVDLEAKRETFSLASGRSVSGYTLNGRSPGPTITAVEGQLVEVRLSNASVPEGITLHWHGVDVPNAEDGVAGVTQDAVEIGDEHVYRFIADVPGTYWYHSHQVSHEQVREGLLGPLMILPQTDDEMAASWHWFTSTKGSGR